VVELLKVLLRCEAERLGVASKLLATMSDLEEIAASDNADVQALKGWRREAFGEKALRLKRGEIGLVMQGKRVLIFDVAAGAVVEGAE
jgi:ribonuclease D